ncbi:hypothetical protein Tco_1199768 [Tanacetum coccineum]
MDLLQKVLHHGIDLWLQIQIFYDHVFFPLKREIDHTTGGKLHDKSIKESWKIIEDLALYDNKSWNDLRDFAKPIKAITLPQDVLKTSDRCLLELEDQINYLLKGLKMTSKTNTTSSSITNEASPNHQDKIHSLFKRVLTQNPVTNTQA